MHTALLGATTGPVTPGFVHAYSAPVSIHQTRQSRETASATRVLVGEATGNLSWDDDNWWSRASRGRHHCEGSTK